MGFWLATIVGGFRLVYSMVWVWGFLVGFDVGGFRGVVFAGGLILDCFGLVRLDMFAQLLVWVFGCLFGVVGCSKFQG